MIEIILLVRLCSRIGQIVRDKGRAAIGYQLLTVLLWIGGEVAGAYVGLSQDLGNGTYLLALIGAAAGALTAYLIASAVPRTRARAAIGEVFE